jgi:hypothetical protein
VISIPRADWNLADSILGPAWTIRGITKAKKNMQMIEKRIESTPTPADM